MTLQRAAAHYAQAPVTKKGIVLERHVLSLVEPQIFALCRVLLRAVPTDDQLQEARIAALGALRTYDPARARFTAYLALCVRQALFRSQSQIIRIPEYQRTLLNKLDALKAHYLYEHDRTPTDEEIAADLSLTPDQVAWLQTTYSIVSGVDEAEGDPDPYESVDTSVDVRAALASLAQVNPQAAQVARLHLLEGKTIRAIQALLRIRNGTILSRLAEARQFLRAHLADYA